MRPIAHRMAVVGVVSLFAICLLTVGLVFAGGSANAQTYPSPTPVTTTPTATATTTTPTATPTTPVATPTTPVATATTPAAATQPANAPIKLTLTGANEVPPVTSSATGTFLATAGVSSLGYTLTASGAATGFTMAHIHMGACGTNAPVVVLLFSNPTGAPTISVSGTVTDASLVGPLAGKTMKDFNDAMNSGLLYVNAHTLANPTGEIRACIAAAPTAPATGSGTAASSNSNFALFAALAGVAGLMTVAGTAAVTLRRRN